MEMASSFAYVNRRQVKYDEDQMIDTNVVCLKFNGLKEAEKDIQMGDPFLCNSCKSCFNVYSTLLTLEEYKKFIEISKISTNITSLEEEKDDSNKDTGKINQSDFLRLEDIKSYNKVWICEFCEKHNIVSIEKEEVPSKDDIIYFKQNFSQVKNPIQSEKDITVIFCIDTSGSMSITTEIEGKHDLKHGLSAEEYEMLKQFIENGADQYLPNQKKNSTYISRKQCVFAAIENQIHDMLKTNPKRKVGLVTFNSEVCIIGDGFSIPEIIAGDKLQKKDLCMQIGMQFYEKLLSNDVSKSNQTLLNKFEKIEANGRTALGPAILASIGLASQGKEGSMVIVCTDGLANVGLGELDGNNLELAEDFYNEVGEYAKSKGISISVLSIKGEGCKLEILGKVADLTSGNLTRVDPKEITKDFSNILKDEVIGTKAEVKVKIHKGFKIRNEKPENLSEGGSYCKKELGNVTAKTEWTLEYENKSDEEIKCLGIDINDIKEIPFQALISYISTEGHQLLRVITRKQKATQDQTEAEKHAKIDILANNALQRQADFAYGGNYLESKAVGKKWDNYIQQNVLMNNLEKAEYYDHYSSYASHNKKISDVVEKHEARKEKKKSGGILSGITNLFCKSNKKEMKDLNQRVETTSPKHIQQIQPKGGSMQNNKECNLSEMSESNEDEQEDEEAEIIFKYKNRK